MSKKTETTRLAHRTELKAEPLASRETQRIARPAAESKRQSEIGRPMKGADIVIACLEREGVEVLFGYPGGASLELHQSLSHSKIRVILPRHEQGEAFAAEGYARASGKPGVCIATSGPGATNLITGITDAYVDSIPMIAITGQVPTAVIGKGAFQETDVFGVTLPIVKHSYLITDINDIPRVIKEAFHIATTGRPGPVLVDIPKDIQQATTQPIFPKEINLRGYHPEQAKIDELQVNEIAGLIEKSERPVIYAGGGVISSGAHRELLEFAEKTNIPVALTLMGLGAFPQNHPLSLRWFGMHGTVYGNYAVDAADLLIAIGVRFDDRITGKVSEFCKHGRVVHIDIDPSELNKNKIAHVGAVSDVRYALQQLNKIVRKKPFTDWHAQIAEWQKKYPFHYSDTDDAIQPQHAIETLYELTKGEAVITTGVGQHQIWAAQYYPVHRPRQFLSSLGLGAMGFGYPAALGAKLACPDKQVIDIDGDGSFLMNIQELATARIERIGAKALILNNQHLGMVVQWEDRFYGRNRGNTFLGDPKNPDKLYPDFVAIAKGFDVPGRQVRHKKDLRPAMEEMLACDGPYVLDVIVPYTVHVLPFIPANKTVRDIIID